MQPLPVLQATGQPGLETTSRISLQTQESLSKVMGNPILSNVEQGAHLPALASADELFILDHCTALYISNGERS